MRIADRAREIGDVLRADGAALDGDLRLRRVVDVALVVLRIEDDRVEPVVGDLLHGVGPADARVRAGHEDAAEDLVLGPSEAVVLRVGGGHARERPGDRDRRARRDVRVALADRRSQLLGAVDFGELEVGRRDRRDRLAGLNLVFELQRLAVDAAALRELALQVGGDVLGAVVILVRCLLRRGAGIAGRVEESAEGALDARRRPARAIGRSVASALRRARLRGARGQQCEDRTTEAGTHRTELHCPHHPMRSLMNVVRRSPMSLCVLRLG